jgi:hypothetical protein
MNYYKLMNVKLLFFKYLRDPPPVKNYEITDKGIKVLLHQSKTDHHQSPLSVPRTFTSFMSGTVAQTGGMLA